MHDPLVDRVIGAMAYGNDGVRLGVVSELFVDDDSGAPLFLAINGEVGVALYVPAESTIVNGDSVVVPYSRPRIAGAPAVSLEDGLMSEEEKRSLLHYFGLGERSAPAPTHRSRFRNGSRPAGRVPPAGGVVEAGEYQAALSLSREHLVTTSLWAPYERVKIRKYVTTEMRTITVSVRIEHLTIESERLIAGATIADPADARPGNVGLAQGSVLDIVLHEEQPVVHLDVVPVERIRVSIKTESGQETVTARLRSEALTVEELT